MADNKISALTAGAPALSTDELAVARSGTNVKLDVVDLFQPVPVQIQADLGTSSAPGVSFTGRTNVGLYSPAADQVTLSALTGSLTSSILVETNGANPTVVQTVSRGGGAPSVLNTAAATSTVPSNTLTLNDGTNRTVSVVDSAGPANHQHAITIAGAGAAQTVVAAFNGLAASSTVLSYTNAADAAKVTTLAQDSSVPNLTTAVTDGSNTNTITQSSTTTTFSKLILATAGTLGAPGYSFSADPDTGLYQSAGAGNLQIGVDGAEQIRVTNTTIYTLTPETRLDSDSVIGWAAGSALAGAADTGLARAAAGIVKVTDGASVLGGILSVENIGNNTGTLNLTNAQSGYIITNTGDADGAIVNLPDNPTLGFNVRVVVTAAFTVTINAASGESIYDGATPGASIAADAVGEWIYLVAVTGGSGAAWMVLGKAGTWTLS